MTSPSHKPTLREQLDAVRPDSDDLRDPQLQEAARAVEESPQWQQTFERQEQFDRQVATAMQAVDVPEGLQSRLLEALAEAGQEDESRATPASEPPAPLTRRKLLRLASTVAALLLAATAGWLLVPRDGSPITLAQAREQVPTVDGAIDLSELVDFDDRSFAVALPSPGWSNKTERVSLKGLHWTGDARHDGALYEFTAAGGRIHGYLLVVPAARISDPPELTRMSTSGIAYEPVPNTAWIGSGGDYVYICFVDQGDLPRLQRLLYPQAA